MIEDRAGPLLADIQAVMIMSALDLKQPSRPAVENGRFAPPFQPFSAIDNNAESGPIHQSSHRASVRYSGTVMV